MAAVDPYDPLVNAPELDGVIGRCLAKSPDDRYQTIAELAAALSPFARDPNRALHVVTRAKRVLGRAAAATPQVTPLPAPGRAPTLGGEPGTLSGETGTLSPRKRTGVVLALAVLLAAAAAAVLVWQSQKTTAVKEGREGEKIRMEAVSPPPPPVDAAAPVAVIDAGESLDAAIPAAPVIKKPPIKKPPIKTPPIKKPPPVPKEGSGSATVAPPPPPPEKKCNVYESRTGCR